ARALDPFNNAVVGYVGTIHFTTTDSGAGVALPANYTFQAADNGVHAFAGGATLVSAGAQTVAATDIASAGISGTSAVTVNPAATNHLGVAAPAAASAGIAFNVTVR